MGEKPKKRRWLTAAVLALALLLPAVGGGDPATETIGAAELGVARPSAAEPAGAVTGRKLVPVGKAVGIKLFSDGVLVVGLAPVATAAGETCPGRDCGLREGDIITHVAGDEVDTIEEIRAIVADGGGEPVTIQAMRGQKQLQLTAAPAANDRGEYQLGVWLRDSMAGIGTVTFYDPDSGTFAALGHGINDTDTATLMPLETGGIMAATVADVKKGVSGQPGELHGEFDLKRDLGTLYANTDRGVFGRLDGAELAGSRAALETGRAKAGAAVILSNVREDEVEEFEVEITHLSAGGEKTRNLMLRVTDPDLLTATGGIVQGMSGSPIIQNGRIVGAVTHVLVNDPTRGYGIFIENMLEAAGGGNG